MGVPKKISVRPFKEAEQSQITRDAKRIKDQLGYRSDKEIIEELPLLPIDRLEWEIHCRPFIKGEKNRLPYLPMMREAILDQHPFKHYFWARQWGKTTEIGSDLAYAASIHNDYDQGYFNFKQDNLRTFSENKFRQDIFGKDPLAKYVSGISKLGAMNRVVLKTRSIIDILLPGEMWENALGKSLKRMVIDEGQDIDWEGFFNARETQADTMGDLIVAGVGGFTDTAYHRMWLSTNQMEWEFKFGEPYKGYENMSWRRELEERCFNSKGLEYDEELEEVLAGKWIPKVPQHYSRHGYHLSQLQNPKIPLTIQDAVEIYHVSPEWSIEWKKSNPDITSIEFRRNVMAEFVEGELKPITTKMMLALFDKTVGLTRAEDVDHQAGRVYIGIDWGGGGKTIVWIWQCIDEAGPIFKLLWVEKIETDDVEVQKDFCINLIDAYEGDQIVVDAGGGTRQVQALQIRYGRRCIKNSYHPRPERPLPTQKELVIFNREMRYVIDRTFSIDRVIDLIKHPYKYGDFVSNRIILPGKDYDEVKWIVRQFVALEGSKEKLKNTGQMYIKYTHKDIEPDDALQACNYSFIAWDIGHGGRKVEFTQLKPKDPFDDGYSTNPSY